MSLSNMRLYKGIARLLPAGALLSLMACTPMLDRTRLYEDGPVQRMAVTAPGVDRNTGPFCGNQALGPGQAGGKAKRPGGAYIVGPGDSLKFNIFGETGMNDLTARVDDGGYVQLPIVKLVKVAGKTTREIQAELIDAYVGEFNAPWVTVELVDSKSAPIYFLGEFREPGVRYVTGSTNILEAIALAGGLEEDAYLPGARLLRNDQICTVDLNALLRNGAFDQNVWIKPDDVIFAPTKEDMSVYVLGAVASPQAVPFGTDGRTLLQVLSMVGGPKPGSAYLSDVRVIRAFTPTRGELIVVDVAAMLAGRGLDFPLEPGDVVFVPRSALGDWNVALGEILPSLQLISGVLTPITLIQSLKE
jgi:polysaccharide export outer membrane protein